MQTTTVNSFDHSYLTRIVEVTNNDNKEKMQFCFQNVTSAESAIKQHAFPDNYQIDIRKPTTEEKSQEVEFFTRDAFNSKFADIETALSGLMRQPSVFNKSDGEIEHMLTPTMKPQSAVSQLFFLNGISDTELQGKLSPALTALHEMATENNTDAVRSWISDNANGKNPDTSGLFALVKEAESKQNDVALSLIMGYARYEMCKDEISEHVQGAISKHSLSGVETGQLLHMMDDILMQQYSFEADKSGSGLVTLSSNTLVGDPVFSMSKFINDKLSKGHDAAELVDHLEVKSPKENINSLKRMWDQLDTPKASLKEILVDRYPTNSTQQALFHSYVTGKEIKLDDTNFRDSLKGPSKDDWALGMNRLLESLDKDGKVDLMETDADMGDVKGLRKNDILFHQWLNRLLEPIQFAYGDLSDLSMQDKQEIQQALESSHYLYGDLANTVPVVMKAIEAIENGIDLKVGAGDLSASHRTEPDHANLRDFFAENPLTNSNATDLAKKLEQEFGSRATLYALYEHAGLADQYDEDSSQFLSKSNKWTESLQGEVTAQNTKGLHFFLTNIIEATKGPSPQEQVQIDQTATQLIAAASTNKDGMATVIKGLEVLKTRSEDPFHDRDYTVNATLLHMTGKKDEAEVRAKEAMKALLEQPGVNDNSFRMIASELASAYQSKLENLNVSSKGELALMIDRTANELKEAASTNKAGSDTVIKGLEILKSRSEDPFHDSEYTVAATLLNMRGDDPAQIQAKEAMKLLMDQPYVTDDNFREIAAQLLAAYKEK
ncbi:hypothetical protein [Thalassomonas sp. RHCl1]|uniref:hypothetical protein n=1 Tax=Thalassomonas sp. RHCl1 TaxID=2995320 RepID=UPI00248C6900|nr:hypothetical protein [Thalassomonas sp. RHCl1]